VTARARMNELAKAFALRVVRALISPPDQYNIPTGVIADKIMDDLHDVQVIVTGEVRDVKRVTLQLTLSGAVAQAILRAAAIPDPAPLPAPFTGLDMSDVDPAPLCPHGVRNVSDCMYCTPLTPVIKSGDE